MSSARSGIVGRPGRQGAPCGRGLPWLLPMFLCALLLVPHLAAAAIPNHLQRITVRPKSHFTRITIITASEPAFEVTGIAGNRLRIRLRDTDGILSRQYRRYSDSNIGGLVLSRGGNDLLITFAVAPGRVGWRATHLDGLTTLSLDVGPLFAAPEGGQRALPGRERIRNGAEKLLKNFDPPIKPDIPFVPTDRKSLTELLNQEEQAQFLAAEGALYKGKLTAAEEAFSAFAARDTRIRPLSLFRLGEAQYRLQKYRQALETFREASRLWEAFLRQNPAVMFYYGDSIARSGDLPGGRQLLARLIIDHADKKYAPVLLVRLADVLSRQGRSGEARAIYATVAGAFDGNKAHHMAAMKLADEAFLDAGPVNYRRLAEQYRQIAAATGDYDLREETTFKHALLEAISGPPGEALELVAAYQKRYPRGVYSTVVRDIREDLVALTYLGASWAKDAAGLIRLATDNQEYLATAARQEGFFKSLSAAFEQAGRPLDLIALYAGLLERPWLQDGASAQLTLQVAEQAELLGDTLMARRVLQDFLQRHPAHAQSQWARERLAAIQFAANELSAVRGSLSWLQAKDARALYPASYYYLGKALWGAGEAAGAARSMELYLAAVAAEKRPPPLTVDAYYVAAGARQAMGDRKGGIALLERGMAQVPPERKEQFLYKMGELALQDGRRKEARQYFEKIVKEGKDQDWQRLARLSLAEIDLSPPPSQRKNKVNILY